MGTSRQQPSISHWLRAAVLLIGALLSYSACTRPGTLQSPTPIPSPAATIFPDLPPLRSLEHGGFEFEAPSGYQLEFYPGIVFISDPEAYLFISLGGGYETEPVDLDEGINHTFDSLTEDVDDLNATEPVEVSVAGRGGLAMSFQGVQDDVPVEGQLLYILLDNQQSFTMIGLGEQQVWRETGQALFTELLGDLSFFEATPLTDGCPVSRDPNFGFSPEEPIRVASIVPDQIGPLADFYFEFLRGPGDEPIRYTHIGTDAVENSELDIYEVTFEGASQVVELYVDEHHAGQLMVPQGFRCQY